MTLYMYYYAYKCVYMSFDCVKQNNVCTSSIVFLTELIPSLPGLRVVTLHVT